MGREEASLGEGLQEVVEEEEEVGGYSGETDWEAGQGNSRLDPPSHFTTPCTRVIEILKMPPNNA